MNRTQSKNNVDLQKQLIGTICIIVACIYAKK